MKRLILVAGFALMLLISGRASARDVDFGINVDYNKFKGSDGSDWGIGGRLDFGGTFRFIASFDYYFVDADILDGDHNNFDLKFFEINGNVAINFPTEGVHPYLGGGVGIARRSFHDGDFFDDSQTELGFNALGGLKFGNGVQPFIEFRGTFYTGDETFPDRFIISGGILF